jgi:hypothetical protein
VSSNPIKTRIVASIIEALEAIDTDNGYNYDPDVCPRPVDTPQYALVHDQTQDLIYMVNPGESTEEEYASGGTQRALFDVFVFGSYMYSRGDVDPLIFDDESRSEVRDKMEEDLKRAVWVDPNRGGLANNTMVTDVRPVYMNWPELQQAEGPDLAAIELRLQIEFTYRRVDLA